MNKIICLAVFSFCFTIPGISQSKSDRSKAYWTSGGEIIFSFANVEQNGNKFGSLLRFSPVINLQAMLNKDLSQKFGIFTGLALRNVGYITSDYVDPSNNLNYKKKFRSYNLGIPVGIKVGNLDKTFFYAGFEIELAIAYKEKTFDGGDKIDKITGWFSNRQEIFQHGFLVGIQFPYATSLKFKYYLSELHNQDFTNSAAEKPYLGLKSNIFYFSVSFFLFRNLHLEIH